MKDRKEELRLRHLEEVLRERRTTIETEVADCISRMNERECARKMILSTCELAMKHSQALGP